MHYKGFFVRIFLILFLLSSLLYSEEEYKLGEGVQVGSLPFYLGGYVSLNYLKREQETEYSIDDLAIMGYGNYDKFSYMLELEFKELYVYKDHHNETSTDKDTHLYTERAYVDYCHNENYLFRVGKYNSPIGFWNLLPINVLRETTSSPQSTYILFPKYTTGLDSTYTRYKDGEVKINLTLQNNEGIDEVYNNYKTDKHYGFGASYELNEYTLKFNSGYFHTENALPEKNIYYMLLSAKYESDNYQILTELGSQRTKDEYTTKYAGYLQGVYRFTSEHIAVLRAESYENTKEDKSNTMMIVGYTYRPLYPVAIKSEYQIHSEEDENQLLFSLSVLF